MERATAATATAVIVAGGDPIDRAVLARLPHPIYVIAVDSGLDELDRLGLAADVVIGDFDSVTAASLARAARAGVPVERHPTDKDATDLELALHHAGAQGFERAVLLGGHGGRLSHLLGNALVLTSDRFAAMQIEWHVRTATVTVVHPERTITIAGEPGDLVSLLAAGGTAAGITTTGLRWRLDGASLTSGSTRGISNEMTDASATVTLRDGKLLAIHERN